MEELNNEDQQWLNAPMGDPDKTFDSGFCPTCNQSVIRHDPEKERLREALRKISTSAHLRGCKGISEYADEVLSQTEGGDDVP